MASKKVQRFVLHRSFQPSWIFQWYLLLCSPTDSSFCFVSFPSSNSCRGHCNCTVLHNLLSGAEQERHIKGILALLKLKGFISSQKNLLAYVKSPKHIEGNQYHSCFFFLFFLNKTYKRYWFSSSMNHKMVFIHI